ncbi:MAG: tol-pal system-associated acyl-CoA thioesterase [Alphaproteobacteria bacterium]|nr:tol-pal system-associated acyl-CoA thioesterase [Alphaproteobacteria bacterium]
MTFSIPCRVYYEDTDAGGVVYYASYLRFAERARTEWVRSLMGRDTGELWTKEDPLFVVRHIEVDYKAPARLDNSLTVTTEFLSIGGASLDLAQNIKRDEEVLVAIKVTLVSTTHDGKVLRIPPEWRQKLAAV